MKYLKLIWIPIILILAYSIFLRSPYNKDGKKAPDFKAELIDGTNFKLSDLKGQYVLLDFWGSWCALCRKDNRNLVKLHNEFNGKTYKGASGFEIVSVALEKDDKRWRKASEKDGFIWKHQIFTQSKVILLSPIAQKYNVSDLPSKFLINPKGKIIGVNQSYNELADFLREKKL